MSGGSMDYLSYKVADASFSIDTPERKAFKQHLQLVSNALRDIEWVDSGDCGPGFENESIRACLREGATLEAAIEDAHAALKVLRDELERAGRGNPPARYIHGAGG